MMLELVLELYQESPLLPPPTNNNNKIKDQKTHLDERERGRGREREREYPTPTLPTSVTFACLWTVYVICGCFQTLDQHLCGGLQCSLHVPDGGQQEK